MVPSIESKPYPTSQYSFSKLKPYIRSGLLTVCLYTLVEENKDGSATYSFVTNRYRKMPAKSPDGMFAELKIPNNLQLVVDTLNEYYN